MGVDLIKYPYEVDCRFLDDPAAPTSKVQWTVAHPDAPTLPYPSAVYNVVMEPEPLRWDLPVGEVWNGYGRSATWKKTPAGINGQKFCGTPSDFMNGGAYLPDEPPALYGANGWLICCGRLPVFKGGAGAGGLIVPNVVRAIRQYGYAGAGGVIRPVVLNPTTLPGGGKGGGRLQFQLTPPLVPAGGGKGGGILQFQLRPPSVPSGGGKSGGVLNFQLTPTPALSGGGKSGGVIPFVLSPATPISGGGKGGGALPFVLSPATPISGGGKGGGALPSRLSTSGGISGGGKGGGSLTATVSSPVLGVTNTSSFVGTAGFFTPSAAVAGNLLVLYWIAYDGVSTLPAGWSEQRQCGTYPVGNGNWTCGMLTKTAVGGAEHITVSDSNTYSAICWATSKTHIDTPWANEDGGNFSQTTITGAPVTTAVSGGIGFGFYLIDGSTTITLPAGLTAGGSVTITGPGSVHGTAASGWKNLSSSGAFNPGNAVAGAANWEDGATAVVH